MENTEILNTIRTDEPSTEDIRNTQIIIKRLIRTNGTKEINITNEDTEEIEFVY